MRTIGKALLAVILLSSMPLAFNGNEQQATFLAMEVKGVILDTGAQSPVVLLTDGEGKRVLPIWVGLSEGIAIERELRKAPSERPMTHDLLFSILGRVRTEVKEVRILKVEKQTYHASLLLSSPQGSIEVDARPSDAIVLALKARAPILVSISVFEEQAIPLAGGAKSVERAGIRVQELTPGLAPYFGFPGRRGVLVSEILADAENSGLRPGDIITGTNSRETGSPEEFEKAFEGVKRDERIRINYMREGKPGELSFTLPKPTK
jgi:bifunctional DNase/RNase